MTANDIKLNFNTFSGNYEIVHNGFSWISDGRKPYITIRKKIGDKHIAVFRPFRSALKKKTDFSEKRIVTRYSDFTAFGKKLPFTIVCTAEITGEATVEFSLKAENEAGYDIQAVFFPAPFNSKSKGKNSYHVDPMRQGFILHDGYKKNFATIFGYTHIKRPINTGDCYMPVWGRVLNN